MKQSIDRLPEDGGGGGQSDHDGGGDGGRVINNNTTSTAESINLPSTSMEMDHSWPSLPPIRTNSSSSSSKVSCETLNNIAAAAAAQSPAPAAGATSPSKAHVKPPTAALDINDEHAVGGGGVDTKLRLRFCFPKEKKHRRRQPSLPTEPEEIFVKGQQGSPAGGAGCRLHRSPPSSAKAAAAATRRFRSLIGLPGSSIPQYSSAMAHFSGPLNQAATAGYGGGIISPAAISPRGRGAAAPSVSSISPTRRTNSRAAAGSGRRGQGSMFTLPPPDHIIAGRKKPLQSYETAEEPTSPRVSCMGRVARRQKKKVACQKKRTTEKKKGEAGRTVSSPPPPQTDYDSRGNNGGGGGRWRDRRTSTGVHNMGKGSTSVDVGVDDDQSWRTDSRRMGGGGGGSDSVAAAISAGAGDDDDNLDAGAGDLRQSSSSLQPPNRLLLTRNSCSRRQ